jgi:hypothetical protein
MSVSASIDVKFANVATEGFSVVTVVKGLLNKGWSFHENGQVLYLPIGDDGDYNWVSESMDLDGLINVIRVKESKNESIGIALTWRDTNIGGNLLIWDKESLSFNLSINRKVTNQDLNLGITDINWYLEKLILGLIDGGFKIVSFSFEQIF